MANMRDIARVAGVSLASVSRILSGSADFHVQEATRQRVLEAARQLGYTYTPPHPAAATGQKHVGCALSYTAERYSDKYFLTIMASLGARLQAAGYALSNVYSMSEMDSPHIEKRIKDEGLSGFILFDDTIGLDKLRVIRAAAGHVVGVDTDFDRIDNVGHDPYRAGQQAMGHFLEAGHTKIATIGGDDGVAPGRRSAYLDLMRQHGLEVPEGYVMDCGWVPEKCYEMICTLIKSGPVPTAIFAESDNLAIAVLRAIDAMGLSSPGDVAVAGINNLDFTAFTTPPLTTVSIPMNDIGEAAAALLLKRMDGYAGLPMRVFFPTELIARESTAGL